MRTMFLLLYLYRNLARIKKILCDASWIILAILPLIQQNPCKLYYDSLNLVCLHGRKAFLLVNYTQAAELQDCNTCKKRYPRLRGDVNLNSDVTEI